MLVKNICKACIMVLSKEDPNLSWDTSDDVRWDNYGRLLCPAVNSKEVSVLGATPKGCYCEFEHVIETRSGKNPNS
jgi:hypothetical protein